MIASSTIGLRGMLPPRRTLASAVMTTRDREPTIRSLSAFAPYPANTTVWTAPIRAQASIATTISGMAGI